MSITPNVSIRFNQEQYEWLMQYLKDNDIKLNAFVKELVQERMLECKNYASSKKF